MQRRDFRVPAFAATLLVVTVLCGTNVLAQKHGGLTPTIPSTEEFTVVRPPQTPPTGRVQLLVELADPSTTEVLSAVRKSARGSAAEVDKQAYAAAQSHYSSLAAAQEQMAVALRSSAIGAEEIFRVRHAMNAISVYADSSKMPAIRALPGVKAIHLVIPKFPTNSTSVPFIGAPQVWTDTLGLGKNLTGAGIKIGIIDTGTDFLHANLGGAGLTATYTTAAAATSNFTTLGGGFPSARVVGGWDFAGDAYDGGNVPVADPNPMDCNGHGSHVAGTAAGSGVKSDGTTFTGPYNGSVPFGSLRIGPGVAPQASIYALRVFGCGGSTGLVVQAINWALDPNQDGNMSDHLDVINMSLGSAFGRAADPDAIASDNAATVGMIVVASAGNSGDTYYVNGAPGAGTRVISIAATDDPGVPAATLVVNSPGGIAGTYPAAASGFTNPDSSTPPNPSGQTGSVFYPTSNQIGCAAYAAGTFTGKIALIDRGTCNFTAKVQNAQAAGAIAAVIVNNAAYAGPVAMGGTASGTNITIPSLSISLEDGATIKGQLPSPGVNATMNSVPGGDILASFSSRGPRSDAPVFLKPDVAAPGVNITSTQSGWTCDGTTTTGCLTPTGVAGNRLIAGSQALTISGTSMACPHVAGTMALLRQLHPDWSVEELKALAMNTATHNVTTLPGGGGLRNGPDLVGSGREDVPSAAVNNVVAYNDEDQGAVSVSFGTEIVGSFSRTKKVRVANKGATNQTYTLGIDTVVDNPGVSYSLPGGTSLTVPAGKSLTVDVQLSATANSVKHTRDATASPIQGVPLPFSGSVGRQYLTEEAAYLTFSQGATLKMRVPLFSAPVPASTMSGGPINTGGAGSGLAMIPLTGGDVCTGTYTSGSPSTCTGTSFPTDEISLVSPFELQGMSPASPATFPGYLDLQHVGVAYDPDNSAVQFGVSTWGDWSSPSDVSFTIFIDCGVADSNGDCTGAPDGIWDRVIFSSDFGSIRPLFNYSYTPLDEPFAFYYNINANTVGVEYPLNFLDGSQQDTRLFNNNVMIIPVSPDAMGFGATGPRAFRYKIETCSGGYAGCSAIWSGPVTADSIGSDVAPLHWDLAAQGLDYGQKWLADDLNNTSLPVTFNTANLTANNSLGALLLHHHNKTGQRAQVVLLSPTGAAVGSDLSLTTSALPPNPSLNQNVVFTIQISNAGPSAATGIVVADPLPSSLQYVSDDGGGAYSRTTGLWTIPGSLGNGSMATLHITARVLGTGKISVPFQITSGSPLDPNPANNSSTIVLNGSTQADLAVTAAVSSPSTTIWSTVTFTFTVRNYGPDPAYNLVLTDAFTTLPAFARTGAAATAGVYNPSTGIWTLAALGSGVTETLSFSITISGALLPPTPFDVTSQITATSDTTDGVSGNNTAAATTRVNSNLSAIPAVGTTGMLLMTALLLLTGVFALRRLGASS